MASRIKISLEVFDMFVNFILRERRFLKKRETSLTEQELRAGEELIKRVIRAVAAKKLSEEQMKGLNENELKKLARDIEKKCSPLNRKQVQRILENYPLVYSVIEKKHKEHKIILEALAGDKFYNPRKRSY